MKVVILAGGLGTRLAEETAVRPKPMVDIGGRPILWHLMNIYAAHGLREFVIACGYRGEVIKEYFHNYMIHSSDFRIDLARGNRETFNSKAPDWLVHLLDTGVETQTAGRLRRLAPVLVDGTFMVTYGDGLADVDIGALLAFHRAHGKLATVTAVVPPARFGGLVINDSDQVEVFSEKPSGGEGWINGGFFVFEPKVLEYMTGDDVPLEREPLERLSRDGQLKAFRHFGFWQPMDTIRDRQALEALWASGNAPWARKRDSAEDPQQ